MSSVQNLQTEEFKKTEDLKKRLLELVKDFDIETGSCVEALAAIVSRLITIPDTKFESPPEYVCNKDDDLKPITADPVCSNHKFFDVIKARESRRDFSTKPLQFNRLMSLLHWTVGVRKYNIGYDFRDAPLRYVASAGGLCSADAYVIASRVNELDQGSYYFDYRKGLVPIFKGSMINKIANMNKQIWVKESAAVVIFVSNCNRVEHKYGPMGFKLMLLDAGVACGQAELIANALELRATQLGGLPSDEVARLLKIDGKKRIPIVGLAVGTRDDNG